MPTSKRPMVWESLARQAGDLDTTPNREAKIVPLGMLYPMPDQPRQHISAAAQAELVADIIERGIMTPLIVRPRPAGGYEILAGGRRFAAAKTLDLPDVPVIIKELDDPAARIFALVDNVQRVDLDPADEGAYLAELYRELGSMRQVAELLHKNKDWVRRRVLLVTVPGALEQYEAGLLTLEDLAQRAPEIPDAITLAEAEQLLQPVEVGSERANLLQAIDNGSGGANLLQPIEVGSERANLLQPVEVGLERASAPATPAAVSQVSSFPVPSPAPARADYQRRVTVVQPLAKLARFLDDLDLSPLSPQERSALEAQVTRLEHTLADLKRRLATD
ncbi:MAG: ParB/RepB/Spo0J family partition protein [Chloroflexota bacterium]|nr:ParB/RepB/Spo0J family partition protein [Chloroflexota bacterium]